MSRASVPLAGFQVTLIGRFWVTPDVDSSLLDYYSKLRAHRCRITEGIRVIAFRNMDHLTAAAPHVGVRKPTDEAQCIRVEDKMLADQRVEQTDTQRWLLGAATWVPWKIYMCLLYAAIDNNAAERALRAVALGRKNYMFAGSDSGGERAAAMYSLIGSAKLNGIDPEAYLSHVLARIADHRIRQIDALLPWNAAPALTDRPASAT